MRKFILVALVAGNALAEESPNVGAAVSDADLGLVDYTVMPDGRGLPPGSGNAKEGATVYAQNCVACHGEGGKDGLNDRLVGGQGSLMTDKPVRTVGSFWPYATTLFDYVRRAMPYQAPGSLTNDEVYAVTAYVLFLNGIVAEDANINAETLPQVRMPNAGNVVWQYEFGDGDPNSVKKGR